jgi:tRNA uridine 5-carboxymethylaminomethyl modification enzyme
MDYSQIPGLRNEARLRLQEVQPSNIAQASLIQGVTPADLTIILIAVHKITQSVK